MKTFVRWIMFLALVAGAPTWASAQGVLLYNNPVTGGGGDGYLSLNNKYASVLVEVTITTTATVTFFISGEGAQPTAVACTDVSSTSGTAVTQTTATGSYICPANGATAFKATVSAHTNGVRVFASPSAGSARRGGGGGGSGTVTSVDASGGVETASGSAITGSGTIRGNMCVNAQTGTTYTVVSGDRGCIVTFSNASSITVTLPQAGTAGFDAGFYFQPVNIGVGAVTITPTTSTIQGDIDISLTTNKGLTIASDGTDYWHNPGFGIGGESDTIQSVFDRGKTITNANSLANAFQVGGLCLFEDASKGPWMRPCTAANLRTRILTNFNYGWYDQEGDADMFVVDPDAATKKAMYAFQSGYYPLKSVWVGARNLEGDGTNCPARPTAVTINSGPKIPTFICTDNNGSRLNGYLLMPQDWDGGTITFTHSYIQTAADTSALNGDVAAQCRGTGETVSSTWGSEVAIDDAAVTGTNTNDMTTSAAVTPAGTCAAGDMLYFYYELDATGTTTAVATLHHLGFLITYSSTSLSH